MDDVFVKSENEFNDMLSAYFPSEIFTIEILKKPQTITIKIKNKEQKQCCELIINKVASNSLLIKNLQKCDTASLPGVGNGNYVLEGIEHFAKDCKITQLEIDVDSSSLYVMCNNTNFSFSLKNLYLFAYGKTWYGNHGFNLKYNADTFSVNIHNFINRPFIEVTRKPLFSFFSKPKPQMLIKEYFKNMLSDIKKLTYNKVCANTSDYAILENYSITLQNYIKQFDEFSTINYDGPYIKNIQTNGGYNISNGGYNISNGGYKKKRLTKNKPKKIKKYKKSKGKTKKSKK
jgi:hypothetical protein